MRRIHVGTASGLGSIILLSAAPMGCATTGSTAGDAGVGATAGAVLGGVAGYLAGGEKGALIGAIAGGAAGALAGAINADLVKSRQASEAEARIAEQRRTDALAQARVKTGDEYEQIDEVLVPVSETPDSTTYGRINRNGEVEGQVVTLPNSEVSKIKNQGGVVDATKNTKIPVIGGKRVVFVES